MTEAPQLRLTNTLTKTKEVFRPIDPQDVRMYVCGPTVYDFAHIGNARPVIVFDVLFRLLKHLAKQGIWDGGKGETQVTYVRNITDVDDKINARALRDFPDLPLNEAIRKVTETTANQFHEDVKALGCLQPTHEPRATEFVLPRADGKADMLGLIQSLIDRGHAYAAQGEILFDTVSMADYGKLSGRNLEDQRAGARVAVDAHKRHPGDFVLWKASSAAEPGWDATFTLDGKPLAIRGRPGWHIECSAMSAAYLGDVFDIHGGGLDLIFPHHENEIAQSRCAHGTEVMANYWLHNGFLQVEGRKMSKSEGNFVTIHDLLHKPIKWASVLLEQAADIGERNRLWNGLAARFSMLQTHYRAPIDWTAERHDQARREIYEFHKLIRASPSGLTELVPDEGQLAAILCDDLNTPEAIAWLRKLYNANDWVRLRDDMNLLGLFDDRLVRSFDVMDSGLDVRLAETISDRLAFIAAKNWGEADRIRDELLAQGIQLKDGKDPTTGERVTTWEVKR
jgi:cysteinyl-tRNA synthetase